MNEIIKGMANASEAIQENFEEQGGKITAVEQNIALLQYKNIWEELAWSQNATFSYRVVTPIEPFRLIYVHFSCEVSTATNSQWIFELPVQYRPTLKRTIPWATLKNFGVFEVDTAGQGRAILDAGKTATLFTVNGLIPY